MFKNIKNGWATLTIENFTGRCSYLTDPILDIAEVLINKRGIVEFDEEGTSFELIFLDSAIYAVSHRKTHEVHTFDISHEEFAKQLISNITNNMQTWIDWFGYCEDDDIPTLQSQRKAEIELAITSIKETYNI